MLSVPSLLTNPWAGMPTAAPREPRVSVAAAGLKGTGSVLVDFFFILKETTGRARAGSVARSPQKGLLAAFKSSPTSGNLSMSEWKH